MRVLLISANTEKINMPTLPMGLGCVAASLQKAGHGVTFLDLMAEKEPLQSLRKTMAEFEPDLIGISIRNIDDQVSQTPRFLLERTKPVVSLCKELSPAPVVLGGAGYSIFPESALEYLGADMGIQGEGESAFAALLDRMSAGKSVSGVRGLFLRGSGRQGRRAFSKKLDNMPLPDPALFDLSVAQDPAYYLPFQTRRGCPLHCSYCSTHTIEGAIIRKRSPQAVVRELTRWRRAGFSRIFFVDNVFNLPAGYARDLCDQMTQAKLNLHWRCILYPGNITESLVKSMARAGCKDVSLGFESGVQYMLDAFHKRFTLADIRTAARILADYGIGRMGFLLFGGPGETKASVEDSLAFADALELEAMKITIGIRIYPYTELAQIAVSEGVIGPDTNLLEPRFYIAEGLENWLRATLKTWMTDRKNWIM